MTTSTMEHLLGEPHHDGSALYVSDATPTLGDTVTVRVRVPLGCTERRVHVRVVRDGEPRVSPARLVRTTDADRWYEADVLVHNPVTCYRFLLDEPTGYRWLNGRGVFSREVPDAADFRITVHAPAPGWLGDGIVYQVFPDRFARGTERTEIPDWAEPAAWDDEPVGSGPGVGSQLYGGDLPGIEQHLDHLEDLGVGTLYLTPVFPGRSNHRYDASTFDHVDPLLGGDEALASLSRAVHARGMRIMGDITTNHTGDGHEWFRRARADRSCTEASFYYWTDGEPGYVGWLEHASLPKLDYSAPALAERMIDGRGSVIGRWLAEPYALDGWRVDVANMTGRYADQDRTHDVARTVRRTMLDINPDSVLVAEHFHDSGADMMGDGWHANMNYSAFTRPVWSWLVDPENDVPALGLPARLARRSGRDMVATMRDFDAVVPWKVLATQWNMLGSHDTPRLRTLVGSPAMVEVAAGLLLTYPGTPVVFAGDEIGAEGVNGEHARTTMPWDRPDRWDDRTLGTYRELVTLRRSSTALRDGGLRWALVEDDAVAYLRETADETVLVLVARAPWTGATLPLAADAAENLYGGADLHPGPDGWSLPSDGPTVQVWQLT
ncbi:glycoside hydrolase family 13 protein [Sanguibacter suaedae]|uniref:Glycoside hydrolase family 13 protein n=1 Tax=Sanguibacter suaedae TaxID=2795737 RepID=A0A934I700_9MICO|nr:glycoside hydrolase family 13 protein [Sanguibacter suaedae]MBI9114332.1 glycoside hydrolase family 13 protein [Sanguibacter suaedae]